MTGEGAPNERYGKQFPAGAVVFREGDPGFDLFVIQSGRIQLSRHQSKQDSVIAVLEAGDFFGEMAIVTNRPRSATATCLDDVTLLVIDQRTFEAMIRRNAEIAVRLIRRLSERLEQANTQIEVLLLKDVNHRVVLHLRRVAATQGIVVGAGLRVSESASDIARQTGLTVADVDEALDRLARARLIYLDESGVVISEVGRLDDFLRFLEVKDRLGESA